MCYSDLMVVISVSMSWTTKFTRHVVSINLSDTVRSERWFFDILGSGGVGDVVKS